MTQNAESECFECFNEHTPEYLDRWRKLVDQQVRTEIAKRERTPNDSSEGKS